MMHAMDYSITNMFLLYNKFTSDKFLYRTEKKDVPSYRVLKSFQSTSDPNWWNLNLPSLITVNSVMKLVHYFQYLIEIDLYYHTWAISLKRYAKNKHFELNLLKSRSFPRIPDLEIPMVYGPCLHTNFAHAMGSLLPVSVHVWQDCSAKFFRLIFLVSV